MFSKLYTFTFIIVICSSNGEKKGALFKCSYQDISAGLSTEIAKFPYQVSLDYEEQHFCSGSIVKRDIIVTAAHCFLQTFLHDKFKVRAGSKYLSKGGTLFDVAKIIEHPEFNAMTKSHDIAIIVLITPITFDKINKNKISYVTTPPATNSKITVSGWYKNEEYGDVSTEINYVVVAVVDRVICNDWFNNHITSTMFCADNGGKGFCEGDSGGPAVDQAGNLVGVVSWGVGCALPGVYTDVGMESEWLKETIRENSKYLD